MPSWNAYKVFASGKRAKMPYTTFDSEDSKHFYESILPTLTPKLQKSNWLILNTEEPQERQTGWKWAWCVVECASHRHLGELSERFDTRTKADSWIREQLECMVGTQPTG